MPQNLNQQRPLVQAPSSTAPCSDLPLLPSSPAPAMRVYTRRSQQQHQHTNDIGPSKIVHLPSPPLSTSSPSLAANPYPLDSNLYRQSSPLISASPPFIQSRESIPAVIPTPHRIDSPALSPPHQPDQPTISRHPQSPNPPPIKLPYTSPQPNPNPETNSSPLTTQPQPTPVVPSIISSFSAQPPSTQPPQNIHNMKTRSKNNITKPKTKTSLTVALPKSSPTEPTTVTQALKDANWRFAMSDEFDAQQRNYTWDLVPPNSSQHLVGCRWVFKLKYLPNGTIDKYKARLVAKGFNQQYGID